jgi:hypothetical protein
MFPGLSEPGCFVVNGAPAAAVRSLASIDVDVIVTCVLT